MEDSRDYLINILKEKYEYEFNRKKTLDDSLGLPVTLLSFIIAGIYLLITDIPDIDLNKFAFYFKWGIFALILICTILTFNFLYVVYFGYRRIYSSFPDSDQVLDAYKELNLRHTLIVDDEIKEQYVISDLKDYLTVWYKDCNMANTMANDKRADAFFKSRMWLGITMILGILLLIFICVIKTEHVKKTEYTATTATASKERKK